MWHASRLFGATQILEITTEPLKVIEISLSQEGAFLNAQQT